MSVISIFVKNLTSGGAEKQSVLLAKALAGHYDVHYIIFNGDKVHQKYMNILKEDSRIRIQSFTGSHIQRYSALVKYLKDNKIKAIFSYLTAANVYACLAGMQSNVKVFTGLRNAELPVFKCLVDRVLTNYFAEKAISNSFSGKENFVRKGFKEEKIIVIPNCFENIRTYLSKPQKDRLHIITVGRFVQQKDYETAIRSIAELRKYCDNFIFDIVGYGVLESQIRDWIKTYRIDDITKIYINPNNIAELLDNASIYLSTSLFEGTSNSIMEAMNADLPIVATDVGDNNRLVKNRLNGYLCKPKDYLKAADYLKKLLLDINLRNEFGENSKKILSEEYSVKRFQDKYISLLSSIL